jgi:hypothetical protein
MVLNVHYFLCDYRHTFLFRIMKPSRIDLDTVQLRRQYEYPLNRLSVLKDQLKRFSRHCLVSYILTI